MIFDIGNQRVGSDQPCLIVAEVAQAHEGSLGMAHAFINAIADAGADSVKFQTHIASAESTNNEEFRIPLSSQDKNRYEYWKRMEFTEEQWFELAKHAHEKGLIFLSSPFSIEAVELLLKLDVPAWKIPSGEIFNTPLIRRIIDTSLPILLSTGLCTISDIDNVVNMINSRNLPFAVLQCTSQYPCQPEKIGLNLLDTFRNKYNCPVGLSDHSGTIYSGLAAVTIGCDILEVHVTLSREMFGPDVTSSLTSTELKQLVEGVRYIEKMRSSPVDKDSQVEKLSKTKELFTKSVVARRDIPAGTILTEEHLTVKKPGTGIPASRYAEFIGKRLKESLKIDDLLSEENIE